jgi:hypothetical protein
MIALSTTERALDLFRRRPVGENRIDWLANQLLALAGETGVLSLRMAQADGTGPVLECSDGTNVSASDEPGPLRLFRTLLARLAKMSEEEGGTEFDPYGGTLHFDRPGPLRVRVEFRNTSGEQRVEMTRSNHLSLDNV